MEKDPKDLLPDYEAILQATKNYVKNHQGEKGYINTQEESNDTIWAYVYTDPEVSPLEYQVKAVSVQKNTLYLLVDKPERLYDNYDITDAIMNHDMENINSGNFMLVQTLHNVAKNISQYA